MATPAADTPSQDLTAEGWRALANKVFRNGEFFRAFDLAQAGLRAYPDDLALKHRAVLSLANSGALDLAAEQFVKLGLDAVEDSRDTFARWAHCHGFWISAHR